LESGRAEPRRSRPKVVREVSPRYNGDNDTSDSNTRDGNAAGDGGSPPSEASRGDAPTLAWWQPHQQLARASTRSSAIQR
jgi:hypothetical protein